MKRLVPAALVVSSGLLACGDAALFIETPGLGDCLEACQVVPGEPHAERLAVDDHALYWTQLDEGRVIKSNKEGFEQVLLASEHRGARLIVLDGDDVFWTTWTGETDYSDNEMHFTPEATSVSKVAKSGGPVRTLVTGAGFINSIVVIEGAVYWAESDTGNVMRVPATGGEPESLAIGRNFPRSVAAYDDFLYWLERGHPVFRVPLEGGEPEFVVSVSRPTSKLEIDGDGLFCGVDQADMGLTPVRVYRVDLNSLEKSLVAYGGQEWIIRGMLLDGDNVYWSSGGTIWRVPKSDSVTYSPEGEIQSIANETITYGQSRPHSLAADAAHIYWVAGDDTIWRVAK